MARISSARDEMFARTGYLRASMVARLFKKTISGTGRWARRLNVPCICEGGLLWIDWKAARAVYNATKNHAGIGLADEQGLPQETLNALANARTETEMQ